MSCPKMSQVSPVANKRRESEVGGTPVTAESAWMSAPGERFEQTPVGETVVDAR
jgi:hypothetical protein